MFKRYRKMRQNLFKKRSLKKYLMYGFGEIFLVMLGILLALQINNWNQNFQDRDKEKLYLQSFSQDIKADIEQFEIELNRKKELSSTLQEAFNVFSKIDKEEFDLNVLTDRLSLVTTQNNFICSRSTFEAIQNTGDFQHIQAFELVTMLFDYYNHVEIIFDHEESSNQSILLHITPYLNNKTEFRTVNFVKEWYPNDERPVNKEWKTIYQDPVFENLLISSYDQTLSFINLHAQGLEKARALQDHIDKLIRAY